MTSTKSHHQHNLVLNMLGNISVSLWKGRREKYSLFQYLFRVLKKKKKIHSSNLV